MHYAAGKDGWTEPGVLPQAARLAKIFLGVMGNIQVDFVRQAQDLALDRR
jgi:hypothetical protein